MSKIKATAWIRDGVLVERMHVNPCAFALSYLALGQKCGGLPLTTQSLTCLVQFAFDYSGISCRDKAALFAEKNNISLEEKSLLKLTDTYNEVAAAAALSCRYFPGAVSLLTRLAEAQCKNFITSAVAQPVLDKWFATPVGQEIAPQICEVLGERPHFAKGEGHFKHISQIVQGEPIYYIADAPLEISQALPFHMSLGVETIAFANNIDNQKVQTGYELARQACAQVGLADDTLEALERIKPAEINLADPQIALRKAGAHHIVSGEADTIYKELESLLI